MVLRITQLNLDNIDQRRIGLYSYYHRIRNRNLCQGIRIGVILVAFSKSCISCLFCG